MDFGCVNILLFVYFFGGQEEVSVVRLFFILSSSFVFILVGYINIILYVYYFAQKFKKYCFRVKDDVIFGCLGETDLLCVDKKRVV